MGTIVFQGGAFTTYVLKPDEINILPTIITGQTQHLYGEGPFCDFSPLPPVMGKRGLYIFVIGGKVRYLGRCLDDYSIRMKEYGHISPSDCYAKGRPTNCHVNQELNKAFNAEVKVEFGICPMASDDDSIKAAEKALLNKMKASPQSYWNMSY